VFGLVALWLLGVVAGVAWLCRYSVIPGPPAAAVTSWPTELGPLRKGDRDTLVMVLHPDCPCSRASMSELAVLAADCEGDLSIEILFAQPPELVENVRSTDLWQSAAQIPGAMLLEDRGGALARSLGATTSGQVFLFDAGSALRFSGGITSSRGHAGNNAGRVAIEAIVHKEAPGIKTTPVFGCSLW